MHGAVGLKSNLPEHGSAGRARDLQAIIVEETHRCWKKHKWDTQYSNCISCNYSFMVGTVRCSDVISLD